MPQPTNNWSATERLAVYREAVRHGFYTDKLHPGEPEHVPWLDPASTEPSRMTAADRDWLDGIGTDL